VTDVGKACALRRGRSGHREIVTFIEVDDRSRDSRDRHELGPSRKYLNEVKALLASVRHTSSGEQDAVLASFWAEFQRVAKTAAGKTMPEPATWNV
jgi:hypothetical protein